jgi:hypothetical protein
MYVTARLNVTTGIVTVVIVELPHQPHYCPSPHANKRVQQLSVLSPELPARVLRLGAPLIGCNFAQERKLCGDSLLPLVNSCDCQMWSGV